VKEDTWSPITVSGSVVCLFYYVSQDLKMKEEDMVEEEKKMYPHPQAAVIEWEAH
jgi:hypothetical protein